MPWAKWKTWSFLVYFASRKGPIANAKLQLPNATRSFLTYFAQVAKANLKCKTATSAKNSLAPMPTSPLMTWNDDDMWMLVYVVCMHVCVWKRLCHNGKHCYVSKQASVILPNDPSYNYPSVQFPSNCIRSRQWTPKNQLSVPPTHLYSS